MKLVSSDMLQGPFFINDNIKIPVATDIKYVHIGIQIPNRFPLNEIIKRREYKIDNSKEEISDYIDISISDGTSLEDNQGFSYYRINDFGILEFDNINKGSVTITPKRFLPPETIIDIAKYVENEEE